MTGRTLPDSVNEKDGIGSVKMLISFIVIPEDGRTDRVGAKKPPVPFYQEIL